MTDWTRTLEQLYHEHPVAYHVVTVVTHGGQWLCGRIEGLKDGNLLIRVEQGLAVLPINLIAFLIHDDKQHDDAHHAKGVL
jgi:hypothetical protein